MPVYYTLTTTKTRVPELEGTLRSLANNEGVDLIWLNVSAETHRELRAVFPDFEARFPTVRVRICEDTGPGTKLVPTLEWVWSHDERDAILITVDDDIIYPRGHAQHLVKAHLDCQAMPVAISGFSWSIEELVWEGGYRRDADILEGFSGVVYRPSHFAVTPPGGEPSLEPFLAYYRQLAKLDSFKFSDDIIFSNWLVSRGLRPYVVEAIDDETLTRNALLAAVQAHGRAETVALHFALGGAKSRYAQCYRTLAAHNAIERRRQAKLKYIADTFSLDSEERQGLSRIRNGVLDDLARMLRGATRADGRREKVTVSLTTIPARFDKVTPLLERLSQMIDLDRVIINIPRRYARFKDQAVVIPPQWNAIPKLVIHRCEEDYGPGTKLLGSLYGKNPDGSPLIRTQTVVTVDDDTLYPMMTAISLLDRYIKSVGSLDALSAGRECWGGIGFQFEEYFERRYIDGDGRSVDVIEGFGAVIYNADWFIGDAHREDFEQYFKQVKPVLLRDDDLLFSNWLARIGVTRRTGLGPNLGRRAVRQLEYGFGKAHGALHAEFSDNAHHENRKRLLRAVAELGALALLASPPPPTDPITFVTLEGPSRNKSSSSYKFPREASDMADIPVSREFRSEYEHQISLGKQFLASKEIVFVGLVRNVAATLADNVRTLDTLSQGCKRLSFFIYENDSTDGTPQILETLGRENDRFHFLSEKLELRSFGSVKDLARVEALAAHRSKCQVHIAAHHPNSDFTVVVDLDFRHINLQGMLSSFGWLSTGAFDAMAGNSYVYQKLPTGRVGFWNYDSWAYRGTWWEDLDKYNSMFACSPLLSFSLTQPLLGLPPTRVNSAFGGMTIYRTEVFLKGVYTGYDCEHVCFHKHLADLGIDFNLGLNPSQIMVF